MIIQLHIFEPKRFPSDKNLGQLTQVQIFGKRILLLLGNNVGRDFKVSSLDNHDNWYWKIKKSNIFHLYQRKYYFLRVH